MVEGAGRRMGKADGSAGFTLIELLMIIAIIGILASVVVAAVINMSGQSAVAACKANYKTVETAAEAYRSQVGSSATSFAELEGTTTGLNDASVGPWLREAPNSPSYSIGFSLTTGPDYGDITVATSGHAAAVGNGNCQYAG